MDLGPLPADACCCVHGQRSSVTRVAR